MDNYILKDYQKYFYDMFDKKRDRYITKQKVLKNGLFEIYKKHRLALYSEFCANHFEDKTFNINLSAYLDYCIFDGVSYKDMLECKRLFNAQRSRVARLKKRITKMLEFNCIFLTYTFTNSVLSKNNINSLRKNVCKHLKSISNNYVANIDFGKRKGRIHFHALVVADNIDYTSWTFGALNGKRVINNNSTAISKYIAKLTNHAIKETTKGSRIIYSRFKF